MPDNQAIVLDSVDRAIINALQGGFPICDRPYAKAAADLDISETDLIDRIDDLLERGVLSRFGPLYNAETLGGALTLAAMRVPGERFDEIAETVNAFPEIAHNYARDHDLNMWFVLATDDSGRVGEVIAEIEAATGLQVLAMPKLEEFFVGLRFEA